MEAGAATEDWVSYQSLKRHCMLQYHRERESRAASLSIWEAASAPDDSHVWVQGETKWH